MQPNILHIGQQRRSTASTSKKVLVRPRIIENQNFLYLAGALRSSETLEADMALVQQQVELGDNIDIALVGANGAEVAQQDFLEIGGSGFTRGHGGIGDAQSNPLFEASAALTAGHRPS